MDVRMHACVLSPDIPALSVGFRPTFATKLKKTPHAVSYELQSSPAHDALPTNSVRKACARTLEILELKPQAPTERTLPAFSHLHNP